ncbi:MAG: helix-turn-helix domain-containing protein [Methylocystis sp.]|uniref:helix-turn-helix domain-containing protein n=1 Tax=Methylocystis sp. TaxID=1911079 RepID=UPI003DA39C24
MAALDLTALSLVKLRELSHRGPESGACGVIDFNAVLLLVSMLSEFCELFDNDIQETLILALMQRQYLRDALSYAGDAPEPKTFKLSDLAHKLDIPKETVRRKLESLEERGWIRKQGSAGWQVQEINGKPAICL